ncbi:hypothetical protein F5X68DRAFT_229526 [Plectosphaerella plurivora]|uniref:N-acetyltransferase domain-containing protein n=1 Tax=Plectosphaerella plurivora TaxID=936078 RepID=A0A9P8VH67_9PEZI|nr:hypothetical protein F5X68DRAFT_229526 [Plectosphaerella plurivora]
MHIQVYQQEEVSDEMLRKAALLFSKDYGIWGRAPANAAFKPKPGTQINLTASRVRAQCFPEAADAVYATAIMDGVLVGNVFGCRWSYNGKSVLWITQLVVSSSFRRRGVATRMLESLLQDGDEIFGILSSHPAALKALSRAFGQMVPSSVSLDFIRDNAAGILAASPIQYIRDGALSGTLFGDAQVDIVSGVNTDFWVDHEEPMQALSSLQEQWPLGNLPEGHEYLLVFELPSPRPK